MNKRIQDKPTDTEAHFQLGICYLNTGNYGGAEERFASDVRPGVRALILVAIGTILLSVPTLMPTFFLIEKDRPDRPHRPTQQNHNISNRR